MKSSHSALPNDYAFQNAAHLLVLPPSTPQRPVLMRRSQGEGEPGACVSENTNTVQRLASLLCLRLWRAGPRPAKWTQEQAALGGNLEPHSDPLLVQNKGKSNFAGSGLAFLPGLPSVGSVCAGHLISNTMPSRVRVYVDMCVCGHMY